MNTKTVKKLRKLAREMAGDNDTLYKFYYKQAKRIHKKVVRTK